MGNIVYYHNKKNGVTYAYESIPYWDKEKKQGRSKRKCIGHVDPMTGEIVPNQKRSRNSAPDNNQEEIPKRLFYGAAYLFKQIGNKFGIISDLKVCFPDQYRQILSVAYYLIIEDRNPLMRFPKWSQTHCHPYGAAISSQRSSELFASISEEQRLHFFRLQEKRHAEKECYAYDTGSISSYSECLDQVRYGHNKDHDPLPQINLALLFGEQSGLPFYYRQLLGNIPDSKTVKRLLEDIRYLGFKKVHMVMDRGFYSNKNIDGLYKEHIKFLIGTRISCKYVKEKLDKHRTDVRAWENYCECHDTFGMRYSMEWDYRMERPYKKDIVNGKRRAYLFLYYNGQKAADDEKAFSKKLIQLRQELEAGKRKPSNEKLYEKYFEVHQTLVRGVKVTPKLKAIDEAAKDYGYFVLLGNEPLSAEEALAIYHNKDEVEKAFYDIKDRLDCRRTNVSSELSLNGKIFVEFIALIIISYIKKMMKEKILYQKYTFMELIDKLDVIECYQRPGHRIHISEMTEEQKDLYTMLGFDPPS